MDRKRAFWPPNSTSVGDKPVVPRRERGPRNAHVVRRCGRCLVRAGIRRAGRAGAAAGRAAAAGFLPAGCLDRPAGVGPLPARSPAGGALSAGPPDFLGDSLPHLRAGGRPVLRGRLLSIPVGRLPLRHLGHPLRRGAGGVLHRPRRASGPCSPSSTASIIRSCRPSTPR